METFQTSPPFRVPKLLSSRIQEPVCSNPQIGGNDNTRVDKQKVNNNNNAKQKSKRSKNGCVSCKKLKIKCTEEKPSCEYCSHRKRECVYLNQPSSNVMNLLKIVKPQSKKNMNSSSSTLNNNSLLKLNSIVKQLDIQSFELQLLKYYLDFGADLYTFKFDMKMHEFWSVDIPNLWNSSNLIKSALYALASAKLLSNYDSGSVDSIYLDDKTNKTGDDDDNGNGVYSHLYKLSEVTKNYMNRTEELMNVYLIKMMDTSNGSDEERADMIGQVLATNLLITGAVGLIPDELRPKRKNQDINDINHFGVIRMFELGKQFQESVEANYQLLQKSTYDKMITPTISLNVEHDTSKPLRFIQYLREYVLENMDPLDILQLSYLNFLSSFESACQKAIAFNYPIALYAPLRESATADDDFTNALRRSDHIALKLAYYFCCILSIYDFKINKGCGVWTQVIDYYKIKCFTKFGQGKFEDDWDGNIYNVLLARRESKIPYDLQLIRNMGDPVEDFITGKIQLLQIDDCPNVFF